MKIKSPICIFVMCILAGCADHYTCAKFPENSCQDMSIVYEKTGSNFSDYRHQKIKKSKSDIENGGSVKIKPIMTVDNDDVDPLLKMPVALRIWISPWHDKNDDIETGYIYVVAERGRWLVSP